MNIAVITSGDIPSYWAHSINSVKHAEGFHFMGHKCEILTVRRLKDIFMRYIATAYREWQK